MKTAIVVVFLTFSTSAFSDDLSDVYKSLDIMCRGWHGNDPHIAEICLVREQVSKLLKERATCR